MLENLEIKPHIGLGTFSFGDSINDIKSKLGAPDETEIIEDEDFKTKVHTYMEEGITFIFEGENNSVLTSLQIDNENTTLFGKKIIAKNEKEIIMLMTANGYEEYETEEEEWGETRLSYEKPAIDFFFEDDKLVCVCWASPDFNLGNTP